MRILLESQIEIIKKKMFKEGDVDYEDLTESFGSREAHRNRTREGKKKKQKPKNTRDMESLDLSAMAQTIRNQGDVPSETGTKTQEPEERPKDKELVWYPELLDDLRVATFPDKQLSEEERSRRRETTKKMRDKGIRIPPLSLEVSDSKSYLNRIMLQSASEFLRGHTNSDFQNRWSSKEAALTYLENMGIGDHTGTSFLPGSVEAAQKQPVVETVQQDEGRGLEQIKIRNWLEKYAEDPLFIELREKADPEKWAEKVKDWDGMEETERKNEILGIRALIKLRKIGIATNEARNLWEKHKARLVELGLVV